MRATDDKVERACNEGSILRTHLLRPTWHFVRRDDIRWLLALTAPRIKAALAGSYRRLELEEKTFARSHVALEKSLQGGRQRTREELRAVLQGAGISTAGDYRMSHFLMRAELDGLICSGARRDEQFTYALLNDRVPPAQPLDRVKALAKLARCYFLSRGPATVQDFARWSGLTLSDARRGLDAIKTQLEHAEVDGRTFWFRGSDPGDELPARAFLLCVFDEYISGYKDRSAIIDPKHMLQWGALGNAIHYIIVLDRQIVGTWRRRSVKDAVAVELSFFAKPTVAGREAIAKAAERFSEFLARPVTIMSR